MALWTAAARRAANVARLSNYRSAQPSILLQHRGLSGGGGDHHGPPKVNVWQDPMSPSKWKEEQFVIVSLTGWAAGAWSFSGVTNYSQVARRKRKLETELTNLCEIRNKSLSRAFGS